MDDQHNKGGFVNHEDRDDHEGPMPVCQRTSWDE
jgi:hypothetical protein